MKSKKFLLVLDLDGTLTKPDNLTRFSLFMVKNSKQVKFLLFFLLVFLLKLRIIDNRQFKILYAKWILKNIKVQTLNQYVEVFLNTGTFKTSFNTDVSEFIQKYDESEKLILSANFFFLVEPISEFLSIQNQISINLETKNGKYTGKIIGIIPYGLEKIDAIRLYLQSNNYSKTIGLADSKSDLPLLTFLDEGYLSKYDKKLKKTVFRKV